MELLLQLGGVYGVAEVVAGAVGDVCDEALAGAWGIAGEAVCGGGEDACGGCMMSRAGLGFLEASHNSGPGWPYTYSPVFQLPQKGHMTLSGGGVGHGCDRGCCPYST